MASLLYTKFNYNGEWLGLVDYIDRIMGTPHPSRTSKREEECAVQSAIERPVLAIHKTACGRLACEAADCIRYEIAPVVDIVRQYTWLTEDAIWKLAYEILLWGTIPEEDEE